MRCAGEDARTTAGEDAGATKAGEGAADAQEAPPNLLRKMESQLDIEIDPGYSGLESRLYIDLNEENLAQTITNRVKELRMALGWTQEQLAAAAGVSRQSINSIERNRYVPSLELALTFARIFSCSTDQIFQLESQS